jgi:geranylgeranyl pyrophosphate synthase
MLTEAFNIISQSAGIPDDKKVMIIQLTAGNAGLDGTVQGQMMDLYENQDTLKDYEKMHAYKTSTMFTVPACIARVMGGSKQISEFQYFGYYFGLMYQAMDDLKDSDGIISLVGESESKSLFENYRTKTLETLEKITIDTSNIKEFILNL